MENLFWLGGGGTMNIGDPLIVTWVGVSLKKQELKMQENDYAQEATKCKTKFKAKTFFKNHSRRS